MKCIALVTKLKSSGISGGRKDVIGLIYFVVIFDFGGSESYLAMILTTLVFFKISATS